MNELISIVIPVYNSEEYLDRCIQSVIDQTYKNIEIILVDDGSADSSGLICDWYASHDSRIRAVHKKNAGVSSARNNGLAQAQGRYVMFIDSDDTADRLLVDILYNNICCTMADIACCDMIFERGGGRSPVALRHNEGVYGIREAVEILCSGQVGVCARLYRSSLIKSIRFESSIRYGEDILFACSAFLQAASVSFVRYPGYTVRYNEKSVTRSPFSQVMFEDLVSRKTVCDMFTSRYKRLSGCAAEFMFRGCLSLINSLSCSSRDIRKQYKNQVISKLSQIRIQNPQMYGSLKGIRQKMMYAAVFHMPDIYIILKRMTGRRKC